MWRIRFLLASFIVIKTSTKPQEFDYGAYFYDDRPKSARFLFYDPEKQFESPARDFDVEYDFIIVGSGSAGSVIANRLSEVRRWRVLLLEIGEEPSELTDIPALAISFQLTNYNWGYLMEKQDNFGLGFQDHQVPCPQGRVLGGSSVINIMVYTRGNKHDYNKWEAMGNQGWSYKHVLPLFLKSEDAMLVDEDPPYHNTGGYLGVQDIPFRTESGHAFVEAAQELGYDYVDYNGETQLGVSYIQATMKNGRRSSGENAFLKPVRHRPNLKILTKSRVTKILIDPETKAAYGVEFIRNRQYHQVKATKEVILSAGVLNSPQLLMLSGVGPKKHLEELGITVLEDLPVGEKMYDHLIYPGLFFSLNQSIVLSQDDLMDPNIFTEFSLEGTGPLTSVNGDEALIFLKTNASQTDQDAETDRPDAEILFVGAGFQLDHGLLATKAFRMRNEIYDTLWKPYEDKPIWTAIPGVLHPKSHGRVRLKFKNPFHWPKIHGDYLTHPDDLKVMIAAIRRIQEISKTQAFAKYGTRAVEVAVPGCESWSFDTDRYWECAIRHIGSTGYHKTGTCKMGPADDPEAVVDPRLRVYGIKNLRVADASIMPTTISGHTNAPTVMIGEKLANMVKEDWSNEKSYIDPKYIRRNAI